MIEEFQELYLKPKGQRDLHHEQTGSIQQAFAEDVRSFVSTIEEMCNPFEDDSNDLLSLQSKEIMPSSVRETVMHVKIIGKTQYLTFI